MLHTHLSLQENIFEQMLLLVLWMHKSETVMQIFNQAFVWTVVFFSEVLIQRTTQLDEGFYLINGNSDLKSTVPMHCCYYSSTLFGLMLSLWVNRGKCSSKTDMRNLYQN